MSIFESNTPPSNPEGDAGVAAPVVDPPSGNVGGAEVEVPVPSDPGEGSEGAPAPPPQYLDVDQFADHLVKIKVDGEERDLPFKQVRDGLMMQEAFTKRTQELAEERRRLQQADALVAALEADPARTLKQLSDIYDLSPDEGGFSPVEREPHEQQLVEMQRQMTAQQQAITRQMIESEISALRAEFGEFDVQGVAAYASQNGLRLTDAYKAMQFDALRQQQGQAAQQEAARQKALAAQVVHNGTATQRGTIEPGSGKQVNTIRDAWMLAKQTTK